MAHEAYESRFRQRLLRDLRKNAVIAQIELAKGDSDCPCDPENLTWCMKHAPIHPDDPTQSKGDD